MTFICGPTVPVRFAGKSVNIHRREVDDPSQGARMDDHHADELLRRALIDADASAAVALRVAGLPLCETLTVVFHGRADLGTIQTYVTHGGRGAGSAVSADELMRVPC